MAPVGRLTILPSDARIYHDPARVTHCEDGAGCQSPNQFVGKMLNTYRFVGISLVETYCLAAVLKLCRSNPSNLHSLN